MTGRLETLNAALPRVRTWMYSALEGHAARARPVAVLGFKRLPDYFPDDLLRDTRVVTVGRIPFPPFSTLGIPEFAGLEQMGVSGITFTNVYFVHESSNVERTHFHELVHVIQWNTLGVDAFMLTYGVGLIEHGYAQNPLEAVAFDLQSQFDRSIHIQDIAATVSAHALRTRDEAAQLFRRHGLVMGG